MARSKLVFLSDVHIGTNAPTNWYQAAVHEPYLLAALAQIRAEADDIAELVIVGDLVDQWTYVPSARPPSFAEIAAANPAVLGARGALVATITALAGRVTYLRGNHDMGVRAADLAVLHDDASHTLRLIDGPFYEPTAGRGQIVCTHGHIYSLLNAPDPLHAPADGLPLAHFITRLSALWLHAEVAKLPPGSTAADLRGSGNPSGWSLDRDALVQLVENAVSRNGSLSRAVIDALLEYTGQAAPLTFVMADGSTVTSDAVIARYDGLLDAWRDASRFPAADYGELPALYALGEVDVGNKLDHFARHLGRRAKVVVMGHTHVPEDEAEHILFVGDALYANAGFGCPATVDMTGPRPQHPTYVEVEVDEAARRFVVGTRYVVRDGDAVRVAPTPLLPAKIVSMT